MTIPEPMIPTKTRKIAPPNGPETTNDANPTPDDKETKLAANTSAQTMARAHSELPAEEISPAPNPISAAATLARKDARTNPIGTPPNSIGTTKTDAAATNGDTNSAPRRAARVRSQAGRSWLRGVQKSAAKTQDHRRIGPLRSHFFRQRTGRNLTEAPLQPPLGAKTEDQIDSEAEKEP